MPTVGGKVDCIYIDPPYNTGNEKWCYNDNLKDTRLQQWLGKTVAIEDLEKHDKWCCMIFPRLVLLYELLAEHGVIFVSIDDNEQHRLRMIMDEIFGQDNFVANIVVQSNPSGRNYGGVARTHEYVLAYTKQKNKQPRQGEADPMKLPYVDDKGRYKISDMTNGSVYYNKNNRKNLYYPFYVNPEIKDENGFHEVSLTNHPGWVEVLPRETQGIQLVWRWSSKKVKDNPNDVKGKLGRDKKFRIIKKTRDRAKRLRSILADKKYLNSAGTKELKKLFDERSVFNYPKSTQLIKDLVDLVTEPDGVVLDSFAGSGTTAQAVMELNKQDGGNRRFILVESESYADQVTAERVRKLIKMENASDNKTVQVRDETTFSYCELGAAVDLDALIEGTALPSRDELARMLFHVSTGEYWVKPVNPLNDHHIGSTDFFDVFLYYEPDLKYLRETAITLEMVRDLSVLGSERARLVYAPECYVKGVVLSKYNTRFLHLPYEVFERISFSTP